METSTPLTSSTFLHKGGDSREKLSSAANERNPTENWAHTDTCMSVMSNLGEPNFQVDDLLDLPNEEDELGSPLVPQADAESLLFAQPHSASLIENSQVNLEAETLNEEPSYGLCVPPDELVHQLEWLSAFNEDNFFTGDTKLQSSLPSSLRARSGLAQTVEPPRVAHKARDNFHSRSPISVLEEGSHSNANPWALNHVYKAHRVRKARTGGRVWSLDILKPILLENRLKASYDNTSLLVTSCSSAFSEPLCSFLQQDDSERPYKKMKQVEANYCAVDSVLVRRCTHCLVQKTPQWRAGPLGPKTLCNACGVRYKSGRLVPEYRPAASPSFVNEVHSNSHRRILEMRRAKGVESHVVEDQKKMERVEEAYNTNLKGESCIADDTYEESLCMHASIEMLSSTESSSCEELVLSEEAEVSGEDDSSGEGPNGKEGPIDGGIGLCDADIISYDHHLHEKGKTGKDTHV